MNRQEEEPPSARTPRNPANPLDATRSGVRQSVDTRIDNPNSQSACELGSVPDQGGDAGEKTGQWCGLGGSGRSS